MLYQQSNRLWIAVVLILATLMSSQVWAVPKPYPFEAADSEGVRATRNDNTVFLQIDADVKSPVTIPRLAAPLRSMHWSGMTDNHEGVTEGLTLKPGTDTWEIHWKNRPEDKTVVDGKALLVLEFDAEPLLLTELEPLKATGDGSFYLPAHLATTRGEKVRYEPQPKKNTIGYWVGKKDTASWTIQLDKPGRFSVAVLQGCGKGQGGSTATMDFMIPVKDIQPSIQFEVLETGHFQNFQWVQIGEVNLRHAVEIEISVSPEQIKKNALIDIRAVHLIRLPDKR